MQERAAEVDAAFHAAGIFFQGIVGTVCQRQCLEQLRRPLLCLLCSKTRKASLEFKVLPSGQFLIESDRLGHHPHEPACA